MEGVLSYYPNLRPIFHMPETTGVPSFSLKLILIL